MYYFAVENFCKAIFFPQGFATSEQRATGMSFTPPSNNRYRPVTGVPTKYRPSEPMDMGFKYNPAIGRLPVCSPAMGERSGYGSDSGRSTGVGGGQDSDHDPSRDSTCCGGDSSRPATMSQLREALKHASLGTGQIKRIILGIAFEIHASGFTMLIVNCKRSGRWRKACEIFEAMRDYSGVKPNIYTYTSLIGVCCSAGAINKAVDILHGMLSASESGIELYIEPDVGIFSRIITACFRRQDYEVVMEMHRTMIRAGIAQDLPILECVVDSCIELTRCDKALDAMVLLWSMEYTIDPGMCNRFMAAAVRHETLEFVLEAFLTLQMMEVDVDPYMCEAVMEAIRVAREPDMGIQLLSEIHRAGIAVDVGTYTALLWTLAANGRSKESLEVYEEMNSRGIRATPQALKAIIYACQIARGMHQSSAGSTEPVRPVSCSNWRSGRRVPRQQLRRRRFTSFPSSSFGSGYNNRSGSSVSSIDWALDTEVSSPCDAA